jgi:hypothetical protein
MLQFINTVIKKIFNVEIKKSRSLLSRKQYYEGIIEAAAEFYRIKTASGNIRYNDKIAGMGFSKDRPLQLHALLHSYFKLVANAAPLEIIYKASNEKIAGFYKELAIEFAKYPVCFVAEVDFYKQVLSWLELQEADRIFFLTDDAIFLEEMDLNDALSFDPLNEIFTFRLGKDLTYCFSHDRQQQLPFFETITGDKGATYLKWKWNDNMQSPDWSYPLSVDGHIFYRAELLAALKNINFKNPNTLEANMQVFLSFFICREGVCYEKVKMVNVPCNIVQSDFANRNTGLFTAEELIEVWAKKQRIAISEFYKLSAKEALYKKYTFINS